MQHVEIEFKGRRKGIFANPQEFPLKAGDHVIVRADRGEDLGVVTLIGHEWDALLEAMKGEQEAPEILRAADEGDLGKLEEYGEQGPESRAYFEQEVERLELGMELVDVEYQLDGRKLTFYFTADGRVDFRELVKVLANHFRTRIDLRQIGARDEAKRIGGIGICGRETCCASWIREFHPVTTSMMKEQGLLLNPQKNTGLCGKLRCCLRYEVEQYRELNRLLPKLDSKVKGPRGQGKVEKLSLCHWGLGVLWEDGTRFSYSYEQLTASSNWDPEKRDEIKVIEFRGDPSLTTQKEQERAGELVASGSPQEPPPVAPLPSEKERQDREKGSGRKGRRGGKRGGRGRGGKRSKQEHKGEPRDSGKQSSEGSSRQGGSSGESGGKGRRKPKSKGRGSPRQDRRSGEKQQGGGKPRSGSGSRKGKKGGRDKGGSGRGRSGSGGKPSGRDKGGSGGGGGKRGGGGES